MGEQEYDIIWKEGGLFEKGHWKIIPKKTPDSGAELIGWMIAAVIIIAVVSLLILTLPVWITLLGFNMVREKRYYAGIGVLVAFIYFWLDIQNGWLSSFMFFGYFDDENILIEGWFNLKYFKLITIFNLIALVVGLGYFVDAIIISKFGRKHNDGTVTKHQVLAYCLPIAVVFPLYLLTSFEKAPSSIEDVSVVENVEIANTSPGETIEEKVVAPIIDETTINYIAINEGINETNIIKIGELDWCTKNLNINTYRNGDIIPQVQDPSEWKNLTTGAWCYITDNTSYGKTYGKLYNWYAVTDSRRLAPEGYRIPSKEDWLGLIEYLGGRNAAGQKMKSKDNWLVGDKSYPTNYSGFSGLPAGARGQEEPSWNKVGEFTRYWSANVDSEGGYYFVGLSKYDQVGWYYASGNYKNYGFSVRCVKDE